MVEPVPLGDSQRELLRRYRMLIEQQALWRNSGVARLFDRALHGFAVRVAARDQHVGQEAAGATAARRRRQTQHARLTGAGVGDLDRVQMLARVSHCGPPLPASRRGVLCVR